jgi:hypothetical protein
VEQSNERQGKVARRVVLGAKMRFGYLAATALAVGALSGCNLAEMVDKNTPTREQIAAVEQ